MGVSLSCARQAGWVSGRGGEAPRGLLSIAHVQLTCSRRPPASPPRAAGSQPVLRPRAPHLEAHAVALLELAIVVVEDAACWRAGEWVRDGWVGGCRMGGWVERWAREWAGTSSASLSWAPCRQPCSPSAAPPCPRTGAVVGHVDAVLQAHVGQVQAADHVGADGLHLKAGAGEGWVGGRRQDEAQLAHERCGRARRLQGGTRLLCAGSTTAVCCAHPALQLPAHPSLAPCGPRTSPRWGGPSRPPR